MMGAQPTMVDAACAPWLLRFFVVQSLRFVYTCVCVCVLYCVCVYVVHWCVGVGVGGGGCLCVGGGGAGYVRDREGMCACKMWGQVAIIKKC